MKNSLSRRWIVEVRWLLFRARGSLSAKLIWPHIDGAFIETLTFVFYRVTIQVVTNLPVTQPEWSPCIL